nr:MAG TPA: hypothetical protein [Caudoviricetes sp.]
MKNSHNSRCIYVTIILWNETHRDFFITSFLQRAAILYSRHIF